MKKLKKALILTIVLILVFIGNFVYGYYIGYNAKSLNYYNRAVSPDNRFAIEIQVKDNFLVDSSQIIFCEDLATNKKVEYLIIKSGIFNSHYDFDKMFHIEWSDDRALLKVWQPTDEDIITTYILDWDVIFPAQNK